MILYILMHCPLLLKLSDSNDRPFRAVHNALIEWQAALRRSLTQGESAYVEAAVPSSAIDCDQKTSAIQKRLVVKTAFAAICSLLHESSLRSCSKFADTNKSRVHLIESRVNVLGAFFSALTRRQISSECCPIHLLFANIETVHDSSMMSSLCDLLGRNEFQALLIEMEQIFEHGIRELQLVLRFVDKSYNYSYSRRHGKKKRKLRPSRRNQDDDEYIPSSSDGSTSSGSDEEGKSRSRRNNKNKSVAMFNANIATCLAIATWCNVSELLRICRKRSDEEKCAVNVFEQRVWTFVDLCEQLLKVVTGII